MHRVLFLLFLIPSFLIDAQYSELHVKEDYDRHTKLLLERYKPCVLGTQNDHTVFGDGMSHILDGFLTMYETTGDKDYLYKYLTNSICMLENRHDVAGISSEPRWGNITYEEGNILGAFARGVHFLKKEYPELLDDSLFHFPVLTENAFGVTFNTFGQFAEWLQKQTIHSLDWLIQQGFWNDSFGFMNSPDAGQALIINMQVGFSRAVLFLALSTQREDYLNKAKRIAELCKGTIAFTDCQSRKKYKAPVFQVNEANAYWWYHAGWRVKPCKSNTFRSKRKSPFGYVSTYTEFMEDMSHGAVVMYLPLNYYKHWDRRVFDSTDMIRFRRTFTENLYDDNGGFYTGINGKDTIVSDNRCSECPHHFYAMQSLMYAPYALFDSWEPQEKSVYEIIREFYSKEVSEKRELPAGYCCGMNKGHAEFVREHWKREKAHVILGARTIVYNQDFIFTGLLQIAPLHPFATAYAEPIGKPDTFTVTEGNTVRFVANEIHISCETEFRAGCEIEIVPSD
jgi:hypothetical protein